MAKELRISCVNRTDRQGAHERIQSLGGVNADGTRWKLSQAQAIAEIKAFRLSLYVDRPPGHRARVIVARSAAGHEYLKTEADGELPNNLLSLPECP